LTRGCSGALKWKECGNPNAYHNMRYFALKARLYPWFQNRDELDDCFLNLKKSMPLFKEFAESEEYAFSLPTFSIGILSIFAVVAMIL